jgi:hypothetical protein
MQPVCLFVFQAFVFPCTFAVIFNRRELSRMKPAAFWLPAFGRGGFHRALCGLQSFTGAG